MFSFQWLLPLFSSLSPSPSPLSLQVALLVENVIFGRPFVDLIGEMHIEGNRGYSATLKFREKNVADRNHPHQVGHLH